MMMRLSQAAQALGVPFTAATWNSTRSAPTAGRSGQGDLVRCSPGVSGSTGMGLSRRPLLPAHRRHGPSGNGIPGAAAGIPPCNCRCLSSRTRCSHWASSRSTGGRQFDIPLVALTGSNGKTPSRKMLRAILREAVNTGAGANPESLVLATRGNLNTTSACR